MSTKKTALLGLAVAATTLTAAVATGRTVQPVGPGEPAASPAASMAEGQGRYLRASGVGPGALRRAFTANGRDVSVARGDDRRCVVDSAGTALCGSEAEVAAGRAVMFVACGPGMLDGELQVTGLAPADASRVRVVGQAAQAPVRDGAYSLDARAPVGGGALRLAVVGPAGEREIALDVPGDLDDRRCGG